MNDIGWNDNEPYESRLHHAELNAAYERGYTQGYQDAVEALGKNEQPTGEWIDDKCSVCGKGTEDLISSREWYRNEEPNFCPFCGAKMEGGEGDGD